jgi:hypothetical protein
MATPTINIVGDATVPYALIGSPQRAIGTLIPEIVTREIHTDETVITEHPVETGAPISDHAYIKPAKLEMQCRFSNSTAQSEGFVQYVYQEFLALRAQLTPFDVMTGKRSYSNMLIEGLVVNTDEFTEYMLDIRVYLKEVILTDVMASSTPSMMNSQASNQADPQQTASQDNLGTQQLATTNGVPSFAQATNVDYMATGPYASLYVDNF